MKKLWIVLILALGILVSAVGLTACDMGGGSNIDENPQELNFYLKDDGTYGVAVCKASQLSQIEIPATYKGRAVTSIDYGAFVNYRKLTSIYYTGTASEWAQIDGLSNLMVSEMTLYIGNEPVTEVMLEDITEIKPYAFRGCSSLTSITIPDSVTSIGNGAFSGCSGLKNVTIGNSVTSIGYEVFYKCSSLTSVTIGGSVTTIGYCAFSGCSGLTSVTIGNSVTSIRDNAFSYCSNLTSVTIGNSVTSIGRGAFSSCNALTKVTFKNPNGWKAGSASISSSSLSNTSNAATYLKSTYYNYLWTRK